MSEFIKLQYEMGRIGADKVQSYVPRWLTQEQATAILADIILAGKEANKA